MVTVEAEAVMKVVGRRITVMVNLATVQKCSEASHKKVL